jgi:hypothetical protein
LGLKLKIPRTAMMQTIKKMPKGVVAPLLSILTVYSCRSEFKKAYSVIASVGRAESSEGSLASEAAIDLHSWRYTWRILLQLRHKPRYLSNNS